MSALADIRPAAERPLTKAKISGRTCYGFQWIGQPWSSCDNCGHPFWLHSHEIRGGGVFSSTKTRRKVITTVAAIQCWEAYGRPQIEAATS